jgi:hypothetical protein
MKNKPWLLAQILLFLFFLIDINGTAFSQERDSAKVAYHFGCIVTITNKGISTIPNLTLGKPAAIFSMSVGRKLSFEPEYRIALEGKPWMFIFWWRYEFLNTDRFLIKAGVNPTVVFKTHTDTINGISHEIMASQRTLTADITTSYFITKNIRIGPYYMYIFGVEKTAIKNTHYIALRCSFSNIKITDQYYLRFNPQIYYLKMAENDGFYANATLTLARRNFPLTFSTLVNRTIQTDIPVGEDFLWNISLTYTFNNEYVRK